jgi:DNA-binding transcriptional ArsR family regulator|tara:strand:- start:50 stop:409 length:360 start_codon:yes stop_codon:yes gene_type:complete
MYVEWMATQVRSSTAIATAAKLFCGFGDQTRLTILTLLAGGEQRVSDLVEATSGTQSNISGHLRCLKDCGLVVDQRTGREVRYRIAHPDVIDVVRSAERLLSRTGHQIDLCPNYLPAEV